MKLYLTILFSAIAVLSFSQKVHKEITVKKVYIVTYDPSSKEFKQAAKNYHDLTDLKVDAKTLLDYIISFSDQFGFGEFMQAIGYCSYNGVVQGRPYCGIDISEKRVFEDNSVALYKKIKSEK